MPPLTRAQVRSQLKSRTNTKLAQDGTDLLVSSSNGNSCSKLTSQITMNYTLFLKELVLEAEKLARKEGSKEILPSHFLRVKEQVLKKYRG